MNTFDVINGGAGTDTLQIDDTATGATASFSGVTLSGVENIVLLSKTGLAGDALNVSSATDFPGLTSVKVAMAKDTTLQTLTAATTTSVEVSNTGSAAVTVVGGGNTAKVTTAAGAVLVGQATTPAATDANSYTSVTAKTKTGTVDITDNSGTDGAVGSKLTTVSVTGTVGSVTGASTLTGKGITSVTLKDITGTATNTGTGGDVTITNATTGGHALTLSVNGITAGTGDMPVITDNTATSATITSGAATAAATTNKFTLAGSELKSLTIGGTKAVDLTSTLAKVATVTIAGSGGVTSDFSGDGASTTSGYVTSISTEGSTAAASTANGTIANAITINAGTAFTGGAGVDNVTVSSAANTAAISLGAGNDSVTVAALSASTSGAINGGDGVDTLNMTIALADTNASTTMNSKLSNFEKLELSAYAPADANDQGAVSKTVDLGYFADVNDYVKLNAITIANTGSAGASTDGASTYALTLSNLASGGTVEFAGDIANDVTDDTHTNTVTINVNDAAYNASDILNIRLSNTAAAARTVSSAVTAANVETINLDASTSAATWAAATDVLKLSATSATKLVVTGNQGVDLSSDTSNTKLTNVNASAITGVGNIFKYTTGALVSVTDGSKATIVGTSTGVNTIDASSASKGVNISVGGTANTAANSLKGSALADIIVGGSGDDSIFGLGGLDTLTGGAGADTFTLKDGSGTSTQYVVITDYNRAAVGGDVLSFATTNGTVAASSTAATGWTVSNGIYTKAGATVADFFAALSGTTENKVAAFEANGNTYVLYTGDDTTNTDASDDVFVQLTGVTGLTSVSTTAGANALLITA